jgi:hypothetical protein
MTSDREILSPGQKLELLVTVFNGESVRPVLDTFNATELVEAHHLMWDKLVEVFYCTQDGDFDRQKVTGKMTPSAVYQKQQGCDLRLAYCKGVECIWSNPECAGNKVKNHIDIMAKELHGYLASCYRAEATPGAAQRRSAGEPLGYILDHSH